MEDPQLELEDMILKSNSLSCTDRPIKLEAREDKVTRILEYGLDGKVISDKAVNRNKVKAILSEAWKTSKGVAFMDFVQNLFMFLFEAEGDRRRILEQGPWSIDGNLLSLKPCKLDRLIRKVDFSRGTFWVQVHNLPPLWLNKENAEKIGARIGKLLDTEFTCEGDLRWSRFMRLKVEIDLNKQATAMRLLPRP
ncbi:reverse transcriptase [Fagus crenata]